VSAETLRRGLERVEAALIAEASVRGALARRDAGLPHPGDDELLGARAAELVAAQRGDGSWGSEAGELAATAAALLELSQLEEVLGEGATAPPSVTVAGLAWLRGRRGAPGRFGAGCAADWHQAGLCHHFLAGFYAPVADGAEPETQVTDSALALRASLRWGERGTTADLHLDGLRQVVAHWAWPPDAPLLAARAGLAALATVLEAPQAQANVVCAADGVACLVRTQRADGTWHGAELFDALDTLLLGVAHGFVVDEVDAALARSAELLALTQNGTWGAAPAGRHPLIAWRTFRHALGQGLAVAATPA